MIIFSEENCRKAKAVLGKDDTARKVWGTKFSPARAIGKCATLYEILRPSSYDDFFNKYVQYANCHINESIPMRGLTEDEIMDLAWRYKNLTEENRDVEYPLYMYVNDALCHIIIETFDGIKKEKEAIEYLKATLPVDYDIKKSDYHYDSDYGIDITVSKNDVLVFGVQIKPLTFFKSPKIDTKKDRRIMCEKHSKALKELNVETYYMIYEKKDNGTLQWKESTPGKRAWKFASLVDYKPGMREDEIMVKI